MANAIALFSPLDRVTDDDGNPVSGALINVYAVGTTSPLDVYSDQQLTTVLPNPVVCNSVGQPTSDGSATCIVYVDTSSYKLVVTDADGALIPGMSYDAIRGADEIPTAADSGLPTTPVINKTTSYSILAADQGKLINASGASTVLTLPDAGDASVGDAWRIGVKHDDATAGRSMVVRTTGGQTITHPGQAEATSVALTGLGETMWFVSDGSDWHVDTYVPQLIHGATGIIAIADRLTAPPASPTGGACYIINGTPTGAWATLSFAEHQIARADGNGGWVAYTPVDGWLAYVGDENTYTSYQDSAWVDLSNVTAPAASALGRAIFSDTKAQNTGGGAATTGAWTKHALGTTDTNGITDAAVASDVVTLPTGKYLVVAEANFYGTAETQIRVRNTTDSTTVCVSPNRYVANYISNGASILTSETLCAVGYLDVTEETENIELQYYAANSSGSTALGRPRNVSGESEVYATLTILDLAITQGPTGAQGSQGDDGLDAAYGMIWNTATSGDPGAGKIRLDNATVASATKVAISEILPASGTLAAVLPTWDDSTSSVKGALKIGKEGAGNEDNFILVHITGTGTDYGNYWEFPITPITLSGTLINADDVAVLFIAKGDKGDKGDTGATGATGATGPQGPAGATGSGSGDVVSSGSITDNALVRYDQTTGTIIQQSNWVVGDNGKLSIDGTEQFYLPDQTDFAGTQYIGSGGSSVLSHTDGPSGIEARYATAVGLRCLTNMTTGSYNVGVGFEVMENLTTGRDNTAVGEAAMIYLRSGNGNTAMGWKTCLGIAPQAISNAANNGSGLIRLTVASTANWTTGNTVIVSSVGGTTEANGSWTITVINGTTIDLQGSTFANAYTSGGEAFVPITGNYNTGIGYNVLPVLTSGLENTALGKTAGLKVTTGSYNTFLGSNAGFAVTTGIRNVALGSSSLFAATTANDQLAIGYLALNSSNGNNNVGVGFAAGYSITSGTANTCIGYQCQTGITTGSGNVVIGTNYGTGITTGSGNVIIGTVTGLSSSLSDAIIISTSNTVGASGTVGLSIISGVVGLGGSTSSHVGFKRNGTVAETKLGDDTAYAIHAASYFKTMTALNTATDGSGTASFVANMVASTGGPTTATQHGWVLMKDSAGADVWVPCWK